jgi:hypothetical protein
VDVFFPALNTRRHNVEAAGSLTVGAADADVEMGREGLGVYNRRVPQAAQRAAQMTTLMAN